MNSIEIGLYTIIQGLLIIFIGSQLLEIFPIGLGEAPSLFTEKLVTFYAFILLGVITIVKGYSFIKE